MKTDHLRRRRRRKCLLDPAFIGPVFRASTMVKASPPCARGRSKRWVPGCVISGPPSLQRQRRVHAIWAPSFGPLLYKWTLARRTRPRSLATTYQIPNADRDCPPASAAWPRSRRVRVRHRRPCKSPNERKINARTHARRKGGAGNESRTSRSWSSSSSLRIGWIGPLMVSSTRQPRLGSR